MCLTNSPLSRTGTPRTRCPPLFQWPIGKCTFPDRRASARSARGRRGLLRRPVAAAQTSVIVPPSAADARSEVAGAHAPSRAIARSSRACSRSAAVVRPALRPVAEHVERRQPSRSVERRRHDCLAVDLLADGVPRVVVEVRRAPIRDGLRDCPGWVLISDDTTRPEPASSNVSTLSQPGSVCVHTSCGWKEAPARSTTNPSSATTCRAACGSPRYITSPQASYRVSVAERPAVLAAVRFALRRSAYQEHRTHCRVPVGGCLCHSAGARHAREGGYL